MIKFAEWLAHREKAVNEVGTGTNAVALGPVAVLGGGCDDKKSKKKDKDDDEDMPKWSKKSKKQ